MTADEIWKQYFESYYKEILEIEKPERDDVFRKSTKFDRPDYGNIPYEIFSVLSNMHQTQSQSKEELERQTDDVSKEVTQDFWNEDKGESNLEVHEPESEQHSGEDGKAAEHADKPKSPIPTELDIINAERESIHKQVIETRQDEDLKNEVKHPIIETTLEELKQPETENQTETATQPEADNKPTDVQPTETHPTETQPTETDPAKTEGTN